MYIQSIPTIIVSIRSLHQSTGRCRKDVPQFDHVAKFQSAPCTRVQGDHRHPRRQCERAHSKFQSAPCTRVQGDFGDSHRRPAKRFQSAPCSEYREIGVRRVGICFNPLPAPEYREISASVHLLICDFRESFNPLPAPEYREMVCIWRPLSIEDERFNPLPAPEYREILVVVTSVIPKGYTSGCANLLSWASTD